MHTSDPVALCQVTSLFKYTPMPMPMPLDPLAWSDRRDVKQVKILKHTQYASILKHNAQHLTGKPTKVLT